MRQLLPVPADEVDLCSAYAYPGVLPDRGWVRANMVGSVDGAAVVDGRSGGLSDPADKELFGVLRGLADAVLVGAGTARVEGYRAPRPKPEFAESRVARGQQSAPVMCVVSRSLELDTTSPLFHSGAQRTIVVTCSAADPTARGRLADVADVLLAGDKAVDMGVALDMLVAGGNGRVLCEGGPHLLAELAAAGRLDELCLTVSPRLVGGPATRITAGRAIDLALEPAHLLEQDGTLFARYVVRSGEPASAE